MGEISPDIKWNERLEEYFSSTGERCEGLSWLHKKCEARFSQLKNYTDLPVIILGVLNGATSIGSQSLFGNSEFASVGVGGIALLTAILSTISSYFGWARRAEAHKIASLQYAKLYRYLSLQMSLPRSQRMTPSDLLKYTKDNYDHLKEISPLIPEVIISLFKTRFDKPEYKRLAWPEEANGLDAIVVFEEVARGERGLLPTLSVREPPLGTSGPKTPAPPVLEVMIHSGEAPSSSQ